MFILSHLENHPSVITMYKTNPKPIHKNGGQTPSSLSVFKSLEILKSGLTGDAKADKEIANVEWKSSFVPLFQSEFVKNGAAVKGAYLCVNSCSFEIKFKSTRNTVIENPYRLHEFKIWATAKPNRLSDTIELPVFSMVLVPPSNGNVADLFVRDLTKSESVPSMQYPAEKTNELINRIKRQVHNLEGEYPLDEKNLSEALRKFNVSELMEEKGNMTLLPS